MNQFVYANRVKSQQFPLELFSYAHRHREREISANCFEI